MGDTAGAGSALEQTLQEDPAGLLEAWVAQQLQADTLRLDLVNEGTLRVASAEFLTVFTEAVGTSDLRNVEAPGWEPVLETLKALAVDRDQRGFSTSETATFVFSLKQPLLARLQRRSAEAGSLDRLVDDLWVVTTLLDTLGLFCVEVIQRRRQETIDRQQEEMEELATPVVKLWDGILALPLIGSLDTERSQMVTETLLNAIADTGSEIAIIDLTGVPVVDTRMAQYLLRTVAAARLMGAECILSGIRPQIAQTIVHLQIDLGDIITEATLAGALAASFVKLGKRVADREEG